MAQVEARIVLTGGPCAGKTTALAKIEQYFTDLGYKVLIVGESATELIKSGIIPDRKNLQMYDFQNIILKYQLRKEQTYEEAARYMSEDTKCIILYDRGCMDNKAYISSEEFIKLLNDNKLSQLNLIDRYDMVIHLVSAAIGAEEFYTLSNNEARSESIEEASLLDRKTLAAWNGHTNLKVIGNESTFEDKLSKVLMEIQNQLGNTYREQRKYLIDGNYLSKSFLDNCIKVDIEQIYLGSDSYERRLRKRSLDGDVSYYYTVQKQNLKGSRTVLKDKKISEKEYYDLLSEYEDYRIINKTRYTFIDNNSTYKIDIMEDGVVILESDSDIIPPYIKVEQDITEDSAYYNINLAKNKNTKVKQL